MNDPRLREVLGPMSELRATTPPSEEARRVMESVRRSLVSKRRRRMVWAALATCTSAAAVLMAGFLIITEEPVLPDPRPPMAQLKQAVQKTNEFRGVVQISLEEVQLDPQGQPQAPPQVEQVRVDTVGGNVSLISESEAAKYEDVRAAIEQKVRNQLSARSSRVGGTILIPLTWEGGTVLLPTQPVPMTVQPYVVGPDEAVTMLRKGDLKQFQIAPKAAGAEQATVWVNPKSGLVDQLQLLRTKDAQKTMLKYRYEYLESQAPAANEPLTIPSTSPTQ